MDVELNLTGALGKGDIHPKIIALAEDLARIHGPVNISSGSSGIHIDIPDPEVLMEDGLKELNRKRLSINAEKYFGIGRYDVDEYPTPENRQLYRDFRSKNFEVPCVLCMKTKKRWTVAQLLGMLPLKRRLPHIKVSHRVTIGSMCKDMVYDENGNIVPNWVGDTIALTKLPKDHPAVQYVLNRGYSPEVLESQFEACYCYKCLPEDRSLGRFYPKLPGGMRQCHQGRIILTIRMNGVRKGYQSRIIDKVENGNYYIWSSEEKWLLIKRMRSDGMLEELYPATEIFPRGFDVAKYLNASGSKRNELLMGYDAAVKFNEGRPYKHSYCILCEGPMDAARLGPPAIAILGSSLSEMQATFLRDKFGYICTCMDKDKAGQACLEVINKRIPERVGYDVILPDGVKDAGDIAPAAAFNIQMECDPTLN